LTRVFFALVLQLTATTIISATSLAQSKETFFEPQSLLLFSGDRGDLIVTARAGNQVISLPPGASIDGSFPLPALSSAGDQVARGFRLPDDPGSAVCHPNWPVSGPYKQPIYKSVLGTFSLKDKKWKLYGDFCFVGSAAFSPDGSEVAFKAATRPDDPRFSSFRDRDMLLILDLRSGLVHGVPDTASVTDNRQLSWSPDGHYLAVSKTSKTPGNIVLIQIGSWTQKEIAVGESPSWSPKGDWIAYLADWNRTCKIVHPDGTGSKIVLDLQSRSGGWLFYDGISWSAAEDKLLLNEEQFDGPGSVVTMLNLTNGQVTIKSKGGLPVLGWVAVVPKE
jgi:hypothetical protein